METAIKILTYSHILAGIISLVVAPVAMVVKKGGDAHRLWGKVFFWCMTWIFISAIIISSYKWIPFLLLIAVLSYYAVFSGYRSIYLKQIHQSKGVRWYDWVATAIAGLFNLSFFVWGITLMMRGESAFGFLASAFGFGGHIQVWGQIKSFVTPPESKHFWFYNHMGNMMGGFIASVTAFSANVLNFMPEVLQWMWPSLIGAPIIVFWIRKYRAKLSDGTPISKLVQIR